MDKFWLNFSIEIAFFSILGLLYYFYQKRKIVHYEENKTPLVMNFLLKSCLAEKTDGPSVELDKVIESLDDYLKGTITTPPIDRLNSFATSPHCPSELREVILDGLKELNN